METIVIAVAVIAVIVILFLILRKSKAELAKEYKGQPPEGMTWADLAKVAKEGDCLPCYVKNDKGVCTNVLDSAVTTGTDFNGSYLGLPYKTADGMQKWGSQNFVGCPSSYWK